MHRNVVFLKGVRHKVSVRSLNSGLLSFPENVCKMKSHTRNTQTNKTKHRDTACTNGNFRANCCLGETCKDHGLLYHPNLILCFLNTGRAGWAKFCFSITLNLIQRFFKRLPNPNPPLSLKLLVKQIFKRYGV